VTNYLYYSTKNKVQKLKTATTQISESFGWLHFLNTRKGPPPTPQPLFPGKFFRWTLVSQCPSVFCLHLFHSNTSGYKSYRPSVLWRCWLGGRKSIRPVKTEWWGVGMVICLQQGADLHTVQLMPLPLTVSCFSKIQIGFTFLVPAHPRSPGQTAVQHV